MEDPYQRSAEYLDIMSRDAWRTLGPIVADALRHGGGPIVDLGAGSGFATLVAADTLSDADILAVEPSPALRAVLLAKLAVHPNAAQRVTVVDSDAQHAPFPDRIGTVLAMNMIGHLAPPDRQALWATLAPKLAAGGRIVLNLQPPDHAIAVPDGRFCTVTVGRRTYEGWGGAEPTGADTVTWHMRYRTLENGRLVHERTVDYPWWILSEDSLRAELGAHQLTLTPTGPPESSVYTVVVGGSG